MTEKVVKKVRCGFCSGAGCGLWLTIENGRAVGVDVDLRDPLNPGPYCTKYKGSLEYIYHPDRLNYPLKRVGKRGEGKWEVISWDQAFDEIGGKIKQLIADYGPESIASAAGTLRATHIYAPMSRFMNLIQSPNLGSEISLTCYGVVTRAGKITLGNCTQPFIVPSFTKVVFLTSGGQLESMPMAYAAIQQHIASGGKLIVAEVRATALTQKADILLHLRPGTDLALYLGMMNVIINENLYDKDFVENWCYGFEQLKERVQRYPVEEMAQITGLSAEKIVQAARMYATMRPGILLYSHTIEALGKNSFQTLRAFYILKALTGNIDTPGGDALPGRPLFRTEYEACGIDLLDEGQRKKQIGYKEFPVSGWNYFEKAGKACLQRGMWKGTWGAGTQCGETTNHWYLTEMATITGKPYPVKAWLVGDSGPMQCWSDLKRVYEAIQHLDLFVMVDMFHTPSTMLADYVLPNTSQFERPYLADMNGVADFCLCQDRPLPKSIPGVYDRRDDYDIFREITKRVIGEEKTLQYWPWETLQDLYDYRLEPIGMTLQDLVDKQGGIFLPPPVPLKHTQIDPETNQPYGFGTPTGKFEIYSTILEDIGLDPLPYWSEPADSPVSSPDLAKEYPLILCTGGRRHELHHSELRQIRSLRALHRYPIVQIHPLTARNLGIGDGDWVWIETPRGRVKQVCEYFPGIDPGVIHAEHGWWYPEEPGEEPNLFGVWKSNINVVWDNSPEKCNPETGSMPFKAGLCRVYKVMDNPSLDSVLTK
jgi:thiosulfate reductase / polysulfide reductase chain A